MSAHAPTVVGGGSAARRDLLTVVVVSALLATYEALPTITVILVPQSSATSLAFRDLAVRLRMPAPTVRCADDAVEFDESPDVVFLDVGDGSDPLPARASAAGMPVVSFGSSTERAIRPGWAFVPPGSDRLLRAASTVAAVLRDPLLWRAMSRAGSAASEGR